MKKFGFLAIGLIALANCGGNGNQGDTQDIPRATNAVDEQKVRCVAQGGFLVPSGNDFACRLENGQTVGLFNL